MGDNGVGVGDSAGVREAVGVGFGVKVWVGDGVGVAEASGILVLVAEGTTRVGVRLRIV